MQNDPVLARKHLPKGYEGSRVPLTLTVEGGLHYIRGNKAPYFSLTYTEHRRGFPEQCYSGGAGHDYILKHFPRFADLAALHLSDIDGAPSHAEANGWYNLAGALGGAGEQYHAGNRERHFPITPDPATPWKDTEYRKPTQDECAQLFADFCRVTIEEARDIIQRVRAGTESDTDVMRDRIARQRWREIMETMRPRWKAEADACIAKHNLRVYGDAWPVAEVQP